MGIKSYSHSKRILWSSRLRLNAVAIRLANRLVKRQRKLPGWRKPWKANKDIWVREGHILHLQKAFCCFLSLLLHFFHLPPALKEVVFILWFHALFYIYHLTPYSVLFSSHSVEMVLLSICTWNPCYLRSTILCTIQNPHFKDGKTEAHKMYLTCLRLFSCVCKIWS